MYKNLTYSLFSIIFNLILVCFSYGMEFSEADYQNCLKKNEPLGNNSLDDSYELCYQHYSAKYGRVSEIHHPNEQQVLKKCNTALGLADILFKKLPKQAYGEGGIRLQNVIGFLEDNIRSLTLPDPSANVSDFETLKRYSIINKTKLAIKFEKEFPNSIGTEEFRGYYEQLSSIQSTKYTAVIPLYMAHLIVFNNVIPDGLTKQVSLEKAKGLVDSTYTKAKTAEHGALSTELNKLLHDNKQRDQKVTVPSTEFKKPSLTLYNEQNHRRLIEQKLTELQKESSQEERQANGRGQKRIERPDGEDGLEGPDSSQLDDHMQTDDDTNAKEVSEAEQAPLKRGRLDNDNQGKEGNEDGKVVYDSIKLKAYLLSQWGKGLKPTIVKIIEDLEFSDNPITRRKIVSYASLLKSVNPKLVPQELTNTQKLIEFLKANSGDAWLTAKELYERFNQEYPDLFKKRYFEDHVSPVRRLLARKGLIPQGPAMSTTRDKFTTVANFIEGNPEGNFKTFSEGNSNVGMKFFHEIKGIYRDYDNLVNNNEAE